jgi:hypothetical protein
MASVAASAVAPFDVLFVSSGGASREERARAALRSSAVPGGGWGVSGLIVWGGRCWVGYVLARDLLVGACGSAAPSLRPFGWSSSAMMESLGGVCWRQGIRLVESWSMVIWMVGSC